MNERVGIGYDVHRLEKGAELIIGGVKIKSEYGCISHSDGDALTHAIIDSILGACGKKDIGYHFPPNDEKYKNISSIKLLEKTMDIIREYQIINLDCTVVLQSPSLSIYREKIQNTIGKTCKIPNKNINIKFKTEEFLGFTGTMNGIKAISICCLTTYHGAGNRT